jgi:hypothetical protein
MIIENLLTPKQTYELQNTILSKPFPWFWGSPYIVNTAPKDELFQFTHSFYNDGIVKSKYYNLITPIIYELTQKTNIKIKSIQRIKANLIPRIITKEEWEDHIIHKDVTEEDNRNYISVIYYVHNCDGDTKIYAEDKKTILNTNTPKENSCYILNSKIWHRSSIPKKNKRRIVINFVFEVESTDIKLLNYKKKDILSNIIITTDDSFYVHNLNTNKHIYKKNVQDILSCPNLENQGRDICYLFGIAVNKNNIFLVSHEKLAKFNKKNYEFEDLINVPLYINTHQILKDNDTLYVCNTSTNSIGIYNLNKKNNVFLDINTFSIVDKPAKPKHVKEIDTKHVNSLFDAGDKIYFCLHNKSKKPSEYGFFDKKTLNIEIIYSVGLIGHGIIIKDNFLYTLSTGTGEFIAVDLNTKKENRYKVADFNTTFLRGLIYTNGKFLIGCSVNFKTPNPIEHSYIAEVDIIAGTLKKHDLEGIQAINDMQIFE